MHFISLAHSLQNLSNSLYTHNLILKSDQKFTDLNSGFQLSECRQKFGQLKLSAVRQKSSAVRQKFESQIFSLKVEILTSNHLECDPCMLIRRMGYASFANFFEGIFAILTTKTPSRYFVCVIYKWLKTLTKIGELI